VLAYLRALMQLPGVPDNAGHYVCQLYQFARDRS